MLLSPRDILREGPSPMSPLQGGEGPHEGLVPPGNERGDGAVRELDSLPVAPLEHDLGGIHRVPEQHELRLQPRRRGVAIPVVEGPTVRVKVRPHEIVSLWITL